jgi:hypothetical protein
MGMQTFISYSSLRRYCSFAVKISSAWAQAAVALSVLDRVKYTNSYGGGS